jgi:hypothetical protein
MFNGLLVLIIGVLVAAVENEIPEPAPTKAKLPDESETIIEDPVAGKAVGNIIV